MKTPRMSEWLKLKRVTIPSVGEDVKQLELSYTAGGNGSWHSQMGKLAISTAAKHMPTP